MLIDHAAEMLEAGERRGRLLWERRPLLAARQKLARAPSRSQLATSKATVTRTWSH